VDYDAFVMTVQNLAGVDGDQAETAIAATLQTLSDRLGEGRVQDLMADLPAELKASLSESAAGQDLSLDEFLGRVADREGVDAEQAREHARAVLSALAKAVPGGELNDALASLPPEYGSLVAPGA
jgi:uncharacterized protein (DUF2267 family)